MALYKSVYYYYYYYCRWTKRHAVVNCCTTVGQVVQQHYTRLTALCPGLPRSAGTRNVKPIWILLKQETVSGSGISWAVCKCAARSRQIATPAPHHSVFFYRLDALPAAQTTALKHCTTNPQQIEVMELDGYSWLTCSKQPRCINHKHEHQRVSLTTWSTCCGENFLWPEFGTKFQREVPLFSGTQISL